jgi:nucleotide-binding universal stress UspA family protein
MMKNLVVALDGSLCSSRALDLALALAAKENCPVALCSVVDRDAGVDDVERAQQYVDDAVARAKSAGVSCQHSILRGDPAEAIVDYAKSVGAEAIAMGTHGRTGIERLFMGSVAEGVLRSSSVPVLTTHGDGKVPIAAATAAIKILVPIDGSECASRALDTAIALAEPLHAELVICDVVDIARAAAMTAGEAELVGAYLDVLESEAKRVTDEGVHRASTRVRASSRVPQGIPVEVIEQLAKETGASLIVIGTHGRTGMGRFIIGSVAEGVVRGSEVPVVVVPLGHEQKKGHLVHGAAIR